ncbi:MAG: hypothetical protein ABEJ44_05730 [Halanaeroarchaeum sp.]
MDRAVPTLVAALLVLSSVGAVAGVVPSGDDGSRATGTVDGVSANTSDVLVLDSVVRSAFARADLVMTGAIDAGSTSLVAAHRRYRIREAFAAAERPAAERAVIENATAAAERRADALAATERAARQATIRGELSPEAYLSTLGRLHAKASALEKTVEAIGSLDEYGVASDRRAQILAQLSTLQGPIRADLAAAVRGEGPSGRTFLAVSRNGFTLSRIVDGQYWRETVRFDHRDHAIGRLDFDDAEAQFARAYPWTSAHKQRISMGALGADVYVVEYTHTHGTIDASLDASTGAIFREVQTKSLGKFPVEVRTWSTDGLTVGISATYPGGPLRVNVTNRTGAPAVAKVAINGTAVGSTGDDGLIWTISPVGPYPVTVTTANATLQVTVDPRWTAGHAGTARPANETFR